MRVVITNAVSLNGGDAAILEGEMEILRAALGGEVEFVVYDDQAEDAARYYPGIRFRRLLYRRAGRADGRGPLRGTRRRLHLARFRLGTRLFARGHRRAARALLDAEEVADLDEYARADAVVSTGGTYLVESYKIDRRLFDFEVALALGRPLVLFTQSIGAFARPGARRALRDALSRAALVLVRDERSRGHLLDIGLDGSNVLVTADAAFALATPEAIARGREGAGAPRRVAVSVRDWKRFATIDPAAGRARYLDSVRALVEDLAVRRGAEVTFISTCQGAPEYWTDDSKVAGEVADRLSPEARARVSIDRAFRAPRELVRALGGFDLAVATRMHACILALCAGTPVLPIAYEFKTQELFARLGAGEHALDIETITPEGAVRAAGALLDALPHLRAPLFAAVEEERRRAMASGALVREAIAARARPGNEPRAPRAAEAAGARP